MKDELEKLIAEYKSFGVTRPETRVIPGEVTELIDALLASRSAGECPTCKTAIAALVEIDAGAHANNALAGDIARRALHQLGRLSKTSTEADTDRRAARATALASSAGAPGRARRRNKDDASKN